jgi:isochorismate hydrolase
MKNINELIQDRAEVKDQMADLNIQLKYLNQKKDELDRELMMKLDEQGLARTANDKASVSINTDTVPDVTDWDALYAHVTETGDFSLLQKRVSSAAYKELLKLGENIPGLSPREIRRINFRSL